MGGSCPHLTAQQSWENRPAGRRHPRETGVGTPARVPPGGLMQVTGEPPDLSGQSQSEDQHRARSPHLAAGSALAPRSCPPRGPEETRRGKQDERRQREGLPGGQSRRRAGGDRMSTLLLPEGLLRVGAVGASLTQVWPQGAPQRGRPPAWPSTVPPLPALAVGAAQGFLGRRTPSQPPTRPEALPGPEAGCGHARAHTHGV